MGANRSWRGAAAGAALLAAAGVFAAAQGQPAAPAAQPGPQATGESPLAEEFMQPIPAPPGSALARIRQTGVLRWGADASGGAPFVFSDPDDASRNIGFEVDIMAGLARHMGVRDEMIQADWGSIIPSMQAGRMDLVMNGIEINAERAQVINFSVPYYSYAQQLTIRAGEQDKFPNLLSLAGHKITALNGTASVDLLHAFGWKDEDIIQFDDSLKPYDAVKIGRADASMAESIIAAYYAPRVGGLENLPTTFAEGEYAAAMRKEDTSLVAEVDRVLNLMKANGELGGIYQHWGIWTEEQEAIGIEKGVRAEKMAAASAPSRSGWDLITMNLGALLAGAGYTLMLTGLSMPLAVVVGLILALMARAHNPLVRWPAVTYIQFVRGTPLLVQIYVIFFSLPQIGQWLGMQGLFTWPAFFVGVLCLSANYSAYEAEVHRAGINAVPRGQTEAALSLGMSERQAFLIVVLPQSFRIILPPVINDLVSMLKDSCLVSVMGVFELLYVVQTIGKATFMYGQMLIAAAVLYLIMSMFADRMGRQLETYLKRRGTPKLGAQTRY